MPMFCVDCKHHYMEFEVHRCGRKPPTKKLSLVTGEEETITEPLFCTAERIDVSGHCGEEGKYFEPRED